MDGYKVIGTSTYLDELNKWPMHYRTIAEKLPSRLAENPHAGKPLGYPFLKESRIREKRVYYLIYDDLQLVLIVAVSGKKNQQATINHIKSQLKEYRKVAEEVSRQVS